MGWSTRFLPLLVLAVTAGCTSPADLTEDRAGNLAATVTTSPSPSSADGGAGIQVSPGNGADGADGRSGQDGRGARGEDADGNDAGTPPTSSGGPGPGSFAVTNNDVMIGAQFADRNTFSFGSTSPGSTTTRTVAVGSFVEATVSSVSVISGTGAFRIVEDGCTGVSFPGSPCTVTVAATPPDQGEHSGVLVVMHTVGKTSLDLTVTAEGTGPRLDGPAEETTQEETTPEETIQPEDPPATSG